MAETIATAERTLPHNLEAERSVLGAILVHNDAFNTAAQVIDGRDFYRDAHRRIFDRMVALSERAEAIDFITLKEELSRGGELDDVGGPAYIASLVDGVPRATNVEYYAKIVKEKATLRNLIYAANKILTNAYEADQESELILDEAESSIFAVADDRLKAGFVVMRDLVNESYPKIEQLIDHKRLVTGVPTGAKWTQVRPGVSLTGLPAASVNFVGAEAESLLQWPFVIRPAERIQASPVPTTVDSTTLVPDWST
jgi:replicative DNA helicase